MKKFFLIVLLVANYAFVYASDIASLETLVNKGDAEAQLKLGLKYYFGKGVEQDYKKAFELFKKSAEQGNKTAQYNLCIVYGLGRGVEKNEDESFKWLLKSKGITKQYTPEELEFKRLQQKPKELVEWLNKRIAMGGKKYLLVLAKCYFNGHGVEKDYDKAIKLTVEADNASVESSRDFLASLPWAISKEECKKLVEPLKNAAENGCLNAQAVLGNMYATGRGVEKNYEKAYKLMLRPAQEGILTAVRDMAYYYLYAQYVKKDLDKAFEWAKKANTFNDGSAQFVMGSIYADKDFKHHDVVKAYAWYLTSFSNNGYSKNRKKLATKLKESLTYEQLVVAEALSVKLIREASKKTPSYKE